MTIEAAPKKSERSDSPQWEDYELICDELPCDLCPCEPRGE